MAKTKKSEQNMTLLDHLIELRNRLLFHFARLFFYFFYVLSNLLLIIKTLLILYITFYKRH
jgi:Sec-independent protein secretion pathway component TatC